MEVCKEDNFEGTTDEAPVLQAYNRRKKMHHKDDADRSPKSAIPLSASRRLAMGGHLELLGWPLALKQDSLKRVERTCIQDLTSQTSCCRLRFNKLVQTMHACMHTHLNLP